MTADIGAPNHGREQAMLAQVLAVGDDAAVREEIVQGLRRFKYAVTAPVGIENAISMLESRRFEIVVSDVSSSASEALDFVSVVKRRFPRVDVILVTAHGSAQSIPQGLREDAIAVLEKPIRLRELRAAVDRAAEHQRSLEGPALYRAGLAIFSTRDPAQLPQVIVQAAMSVLEADAATLLLPGLDGDLYVGHAYGLDEHIRRSTRIKIGQGIAGRVAATGEPAIINGPAPGSRNDVGHTQRKVQASIVYPMLASGELVGLLTFNRYDSGRPYRPKDLETATILASLVVLALQNHRLAKLNVMTEKLAAVGVLAAGIAHEINTPIQFVGDSIYFLNEAFEDLCGLLAIYKSARAASRGAGPDPFAAADEKEEQIDLPFLLEEVPKAMARISDGIGRVATIVGAMKRFGRQDEEGKSPNDLNKLLESALTLSRNEYKYVADVEASYGDLPLVTCHGGEIANAFLNMIVNAGHAIAATGAMEKGSRGLIRIRTEVCDDRVSVAIEDTGTGIPEAIRDRIFQPFFTTKEAGKGTGLGLAIARSTIVDHHHGSISVESEVGRGTKFVIRLPVDGGEDPEAQ